MALLSADEEQELGASIELGLAASERLDRGTDDLVTQRLLAQIVAEGRAAEERMWLANLRLVAWLARSASVKSGLPVEDVFQAGCEGLGEAIQRWDYRLGIRFAAFAIHRVRARVSWAVRTRCGAHSEYHGRTRARVVRAVEQLGNDSSSPERARRLAELPPTTRVGIDSVPDGKVAVWFDEDAIVGPSVGSELRGWVDRLPGMERTVIERRFGFLGDCQTQTELADEFHTSPTTIWRIEQRAITRLRELADAA